MDADLDRHDAVVGGACGTRDRRGVVVGCSIRAAIDRDRRQLEDDRDAHFARADVASRVRDRDRCDMHARTQCWRRGHCPGPVRTNDGRQCLTIDQDGDRRAGAHAATRDIRSRVGGLNKRIAVTDHHDRLNSVNRQRLGCRTGCAVSRAERRGDGVSAVLEVRCVDRPGAARCWRGQRLFGTDLDRHHTAVDGFGGARDCRGGVLRCSARAAIDRDQHGDDDERLCARGSVASRVSDRGRGDMGAGTQWVQWGHCPGSVRTNCGRHCLTIDFDRDCRIGLNAHT